jgi:outer membrane protein assembly factor BamB
MIYVATGDLQNCTLHAVDTNGKEQWSVILYNSISGSAVYASNGLVYACTQWSPPSAYDAKTGALRWTLSTVGLSPAGPGGDLSFSQGVLYFVNGLTVYAIDPATGDKVWELDGQTTIPPAVTGNKVITAYIGAEAAFDRQTAAPVWQQIGRHVTDPTINSLYVAAALGNAYVYQGVYLDVIDTATGSLKFTINMTGLLSVSITSTDSLLFVTSTFGISCLNALNGAALWQFAPSPDASDYYGYPALSAVTALNNVMYFNYDYLFARSLTTRQIIWKTLLENNDGYSYSTPCIVTKAGKVYQGGNNF